MSCSFRSLKKNNLEAEFCSHLTANKNAESVYSKNRKKNIAWSGGRGGDVTTLQHQSKGTGRTQVTSAWIKKTKKTTLLFWRMSAQTILADAFHLKSHFWVRHE